MQLTLSPDPDTLVVGPLRLDVTLRDASGAPIDGATDVSLRGDMSHAGMEPVLATAAGQGNGIYRADFTWTMAGDWIVTVEATLPDGRLKVTQFEYAIQPN
ncbi:MAG TPA: FixH family protein [Promineifilum sp.]|nr:FixH family protein [Promineifilum sp.]